MNLGSGWFRTANSIALANTNSTARCSKVEPEKMTAEEEEALTPEELGQEIDEELEQIEVIAPEEEEY